MVGLCKTLGIREKEVKKFLNQFADMERWDQFATTDTEKLPYGFVEKQDCDIVEGYRSLNFTNRHGNAAITNGNKTIKCVGRFPGLGACARASTWVPREGHARATVRVDRIDRRSDLVGTYFCNVLQIGLMNEDSSNDWYYQSWPGQRLHWQSSGGWMQRSNDIVGDKKMGCYKLLQHEGKDLPEIKEGSLITVTLLAGTVTFVVDGSEPQSFVLPADCGRVALKVEARGVTLTLLDGNELSQL